MRKALCVLSVAAAALAAPSLAQAAPYYHDGNYAAGELAAGAVAGTVVGVGTYNGWWGSGAFASALPTTVAGAATVGGVAGVGTVATIDALVQPCRGFHALFDLSHGQCVNGEYVGYGPRRMRPRG
jgi:hypothetical protein